MGAHWGHDVLGLRWPNPCHYGDHRTSQTSFSLAQPPGNKVSLNTQGERPVIKVLAFLSRLAYQGAHRDHTKGPPMPRKEWVWKNRYCWNSNLDEALFLRMLRLYCRGVSASRAARILARHHRRFDTGKLSRQSLTRYYLLLGDYLYDLLPPDYKFADLVLDEGNGENNGAERDADYDIQLILMALRHILYDKVAWNDPMNKALIGNSTQAIHAILKEHSIARRGIPAETFCTHFAYAMWRILIEAYKPDQRPAHALYEFLTEILEARPIGSFELLSVRLVRG